MVIFTFNLSSWVCDSSLTVSTAAFDCCLSFIFFIKVMDLSKFEEIFRLGRATMGDDDVDGGTPRSERRFSRRPETISLLDPNRLRNVGKNFA